MPSINDSISTTITKPAELTQGIMHMICNDIESSKFADRLGTTINHPAFVLGHLAYYFGVCIEILGGTCSFHEGEKELYEHGVDCLDDASAYPTKQECIAQYEGRLAQAIQFIASCDIEVFELSTDGRAFEGRLDTLAQVASFMLAVHPGFHLGQLSAWRRVAGMNPAV
ncbi:MAG: hypothetical protein CMJ26_05625 [Phycisphaerae bacterium]|nr:hypothetical protein [Phycisphaerae bacterium]|tara:strand:+ start:8062 stop:8568 length:507 start_codon:yes stop_codon:yes gene_type:complete